MIFKITDLSKAKENIIVDTTHIVGPDGKSKWYEKYKPIMEEAIHIIIHRIIILLNLFIIRLAVAAGVINNPTTKIIPTTWREITMTIESNTSNK